jgi:hypothetical protein
LALEKFRAAEGVTARLLQERPDDAERIWAQGQSEYWLGYVAYREDDRLGASRRWTRYRDMSNSLVEMDPGNGRYRRELAYAEGNLCTLALQEPPDGKAAVRWCAESLAEMEAVARIAPEDPGLANDLINRHAWMADAYAAAGDPREALGERLIQERLLAKQIVADPKNMHLKKVWIIQQRSLAALELGVGQRDRARTRVLRARDLLRQMRAFDPENGEWARLLTKMESAVRYFEAEKGAK